MQWIKETDDSDNSNGWANVHAAQPRPMNNGSPIAGIR